MTPEVMETLSFVCIRKLNSFGFPLLSVVRLKIISVPGVSAFLWLFLNVCKPVKTGW